MRFKTIIHSSKFANKLYLCRAIKFLTIILATTILFLAIKPALDVVSLQIDTEQTCCDGQCTPVSDNDNSQDQNQDSERNGKSCNPFQDCSSCVLLCPSVQLDCIPKPAIASEKGICYQSVFISQFTTDFWQPPKIV